MCSRMGTSIQRSQRSQRRSKMQTPPSTRDTSQSSSRILLDDCTYRKPLCIIGFADTEQSLERIITRNDESGKIGKQLSSDVEKYEEKVGCEQAKEGVHLRYRCLLLEVIQNRVFR